jgi:hypothetical protein
VKFKVKNGIFFHQDFYGQKIDEIFGRNEKLRSKISPRNYGRNFKKHKRSRKTLLEFSLLLDPHVDPLVDSVENDGHRAHQRRLQHGRVAFLEKNGGSNVTSPQHCQFHHFSVEFLKPESLL